MDPLAQLADIHLPDPVSQAPIAPGWWILYISIVLICVFTVTKIIHHYRLTKVKRQLVKQLQSSDHDLQAITKLLKFACLHYFKREQVASLYGEEWLAFLTKQLPEKMQNEFSQQGQKLSFNHYQAKTPNQAECEQAAKAALLWLKHALPPNKKKLTKQQALSAGLSKESLS